jgi:hypothetical protein
MPAPETVRSGWVVPQADSNAAAKIVTAMPFIVAAPFGNASKKERYPEAKVPGHPSTSRWRFSREIPRKIRA